MIIAQNTTTRVCLSANIVAGDYPIILRLIDTSCDETKTLDLGTLPVCGCRVCTDITHDCEGSLNLQYGSYKYETVISDAVVGTGIIKIIL